MKSSIRLIAFGFLLLSILPSCKKNLQTCKLGKYYLSDGNSTPAPNTFSYYQDGRLQRIIYTDGSKDSISYNADTIAIISIDNRDSLSANFTGITNSSGYVTAGTKNNYDYSGNVTTTYFQFEYNADGNMTKQTTTTPSGTTLLTLTYTGGNTATGLVHTGPVLSKKYFFYHNTAENKTKADDLNGVFTPYFGNPSKNLLDSIHIVTPATSDTTRIQYAYRLDKNAYISSTVQTWLTPGVQTKYHTYQYFDCKE